MTFHSRNGTSRDICSAQWRHTRSPLLRARLALLGIASGAAAIIVAAACAPAPTTSPTGPAAATYGRNADAGKPVYAAKCAKCHGDGGQGGPTAPAVIGATANLTKFNTAQGLLAFIKAAMPFDAPGSLSEQEYYNTLSYLLVQNNLVPGGKPFDAGALGAVVLK